MTALSTLNDITN